VARRAQSVEKPGEEASTGSVVLFAARAKPPVNGDWDGVVLSSLPPAYFTSILELVRPVRRSRA